jgi:hypothetical protein
MSSLLTKYHHNLANYFQTQTLFFDGDEQKQPNIRKCMELPWQQTKAELWDDEAKRILCIFKKKINLKLLICRKKNL